jgi:hypothetical protein
LDFGGKENWTPARYRVGSMLIARRSGGTMPPKVRLAYALDFLRE